MPGLNTARKNAIILVVLLVIQLVTMSGSVKGAQGSTRTETALMRLTWPVVALARTVSGGVSGVFNGLRDLVGARERNKQLEHELGLLSAQSDRFREAVHENERLRRLLGMRRGLVPEAIAASVVTSNQDGPTKMIVVDRGTKDGVRPYLPVIAWGGAVGRVVATEKRHSKIRLLIDANSGVAALIQRSRAQGIVLGRPGGDLDLLYVPRFSDVMHGDRVVTSGLDGIFPRGFGLGSVSAITEAADGAQTIHLEPELDFGALEEVMIVLEPVAGELEEQDATGDNG